MEWFSTTGPAPSGIPFAIDSEGSWRDVSDVERGLACGCFCAACKGRLVAKKGVEKIHHFAHHDRRDCRHALETSLYGMLADILVQPNASLLLPPHIERVRWLRESGIPEGSKPFQIFAQRGWVFEPTLVTSRTGFKCTAKTLDECTAANSEFEDETAQLEVHVLSYRKKYEHLLALPPREGWLRLGLNLRAYADLWWATCDLTKGADVAAATKARARLENWLAAQPGGRGILSHPDEPNRRAQFNEWANKVAAEEMAKVQAEREAQRRRWEEHQREEQRWAIPHDPAQPGIKKVWQRLDSQASQQITHWLGRQLGLHKAPDGDGLVYVAIRGQQIPPNLRRYLKPEGPWHPWAHVEQHSEPKPRPVPPPPAPDKLLADSIGTCYCGSPINRMLHGSGIFRGRVVEQCSTNSSHPMKIVGKGS
jgi:hypothetical protein